MSDETDSALDRAKRQLENDLQAVDQKMKIRAKYGYLQSANVALIFVLILIAIYTMYKIDFSHKYGDVDLFFVFKIFIFMSPLAVIYFIGNNIGNIIEKIRDQEIEIVDRKMRENERIINSNKRDRAK